MVVDRDRLKTQRSKSFKKYNRDGNVHDVMRAIGESGDFISQILPAKPSRKAEIKNKINTNPHTTAQGNRLQISRIMTNIKQLNRDVYSSSNSRMSDAERKKTLRDARAAYGLTSG